MIVKDSYDKEVKVGDWIKIINQPFNTGFFQIAKTRGDFINYYPKTDIILKIITSKSDRQDYYDISAYTSQKDIVDQIQIIESALISPTNDYTSRQNWQIFGDKKIQISAIIGRNYGFYIPGCGVNFVKMTDEEAFLYQLENK